MATARALHHRLIGAAAIAVGALMCWGATSIPGQAGYSGVGPNFLPWLVAAVLVVCGVLLIVQARDADGWDDAEAPSGAAQGDWRALAWVCAGVAANATLITRIGFILACTLCFMLAVRGLRLSEGKPNGGAKQAMVDFVTGFLIAAPAFWLFTKVLAINLPGLTASGWI